MEIVDEADKYKRALKVLGKELSAAAKDGSTHRILVFSETKKGVDEVRTSPRCTIPPNKGTAWYSCMFHEGAMQSHSPTGSGVR